MRTEGVRSRALAIVVSLVTASLAGAGSAAAAVRPNVAGASQTAAALAAELRMVGGPATTVTRRLGTPFVNFVGGRTDRPLTPPSGDDASKTARDFVDRYGPAFGVASPRTALREDRRGTGRVGEVVRFRQRVGGVPVLAGELAVQVGADGAVVSTTGEVTTDSDVDLDADVSPASAAAAAVAAVGKWEAVDSSDLTITPPEAMVYDPALVGAPDTGPARLVWRVAVTDGDTVGRIVLIDAHTGAIVLSFDDLQAGLSRQICSNANAAGPQACTSPLRSEGAPPISGAEATDVNAAYDTMKVFYDYYQLRFGRDSVDAAGSALRATVRYCPSTGQCPYRNAFWNGVQMVLGAGYAAADDVVGHELTHGVTQYTSELLYYSESGAINESMSDVMGELIDLASSVTGPDATGDRWKIGEQLLGGAVRSMADPGSSGQPDRMTSSNYSGSSADGYGVHRNSGVGNKAAVLIADGGAFNGQTITGIGVDKTAQIYYQAETTLLGPGSDYRDLFDILPQACQALVGAVTTAGDCNQVVKAVTATEMNLAPTTAGARLAAPVCNGATHQTSVLFNADMETNTGAFTGTATPAAAAWVFFDGSSQSGRSSLHAPDLDGTSEAFAAISSPITVPTNGNTYVRFEHSFSFEANGATGYDGGVVEYRSSGGDWIDAATLSGTINGYNATIDVGGGNVLEGRPAFSGDSPGYQQTRIDLSSLAGQSVTIRFRTATDLSVSADGWFVDDVSIYSCVPDAPGALPGINAAGSASAVARRLSVR